MPNRVVAGANMTKLYFRGEEFNYDEKANILSFRIKQPFFSAGKQFHWSGASIGLGINSEALEFALMKDAKIRVQVGDNSKTYETTAKTWKVFAETHKAKMIMGVDKKTLIYVIKWCKELFSNVDSTSVSNPEGRESQ